MIFQDYSVYEYHEYKLDEDDLSRILKINDMISITESQLRFNDPFSPVVRILLLSASQITRESLIL